MQPVTPLKPHRSGQKLDIASDLSRKCLPGESRLVPVHPDLHGALGSSLAYGDISQGRIVEIHPATA
ncbi:MAG: hypothetical protein OXD31_17860 [Chloroflexi bacterium]|nr:hypothetical protein [Chloroflexota bacterium]